MPDHAVSDNPLLSDAALPDFAAIRPQHVAAAVDARLQAWQAAVDELLARPADTDFDRVVAPLEAAADALARSFAPVGHLHAVADTPELRQAYLAALDRITAFSAELAQHRGLYERFAAVADDPALATPHRAAERAVLADALREFRLGGVALDEPARSRFREISTQLARLQAEFEQAVTDATDAFSLHVEDAARLQGIPADALAAMQQAAAEQQLPGWLLNLRAPCYPAVMAHCRDRQLREQLYTAYQTRASDQGPQAGHFDNSERIERILALRCEAAALLGHANPAELSLVTKMAEQPAQVLDFLHDLVARARPAAAAELEQLRQFARAELGIEDLQPWDLSFAAERMKEGRFGLSEDALKPYFPLPRVLQGLFDLCGQLFGVQVRRRHDVSTWHADVGYYELLRDGEACAGFYLDPYARSAKRGGAWMDVCSSRSRFAGGRLPVAFLTCNFGAPADGRPSLLRFEDVLTLFHEFGHGLHHMLTEVHWPRVGGISGVEWDAVELPSQFLENFCWERGVLDRIARHVDDDRPLPDELYRQLLATRHFHAGLWLVRQLEFALFDFRLHLEHDPANPRPAQALLEAVRQQVAVLKPPAWTRFAHAFGHIFAGGYAAGYYSYLWAEVLSADAYAAFRERGVIDAETGERFRREILAVGASRPAMASFTAFRGRPPALEALLQSYGLAAADQRSAATSSP